MNVISLYKVAHGSDIFQRHIFSQTGNLKSKLILTYNIPYTLLMANLTTVWCPLLPVR